MWTATRSGPSTSIVWPPSIRVGSAPSVSVLKDGPYTDKGTVVVTGVSKHRGDFVSRMAVTGGTGAYDNVGGHVIAGRGRGPCHLHPLPDQVAEVLMDVKRRESDTNPPTPSHRRAFGTSTTWLTGALAVVSLLAIAAATIWVAGRPGGSSRRPDDASTPHATTPPHPSEEVLPGGTISLVDPATGGQTVVLAERARVANAEVSPDGDRVVYEHRDRDGRWQIFVLSPHGPRRLTDMPIGAYDPTWSPDGDEIAFAASPGRGARTDIFVMRRRWQPDPPARRHRRSRR